MATYHYCPTGNKAVPDSGPAAAGNPYQQFSLLHDAATDTNWLGGLPIDPESGNASKPQFCLLPGFLVGVFCPRTSPSLAQAQLKACPVSAANSVISDAVGTGRSRILVQGFVRGPENNGGARCHINVQVVPSDFNYHVYYAGGGVYTTDAVLGLSGDPETIANTLGALAGDKYLSLVMPEGQPTDPEGQLLYDIRYKMVATWFADQIQPRLEALPGYQ